MTQCNKRNRRLTSTMQRGNERSALRELHVWIDNSDLDQHFGHFSTYEEALAHLKPTISEPQCPS